jgi:inhibitor of KinA sporulation pathway (predicted exonuclease)
MSTHPNTMPAQRLLIVDVESTCWDTRTPPSGQQSEIIEIGICTLNLTDGAISAGESILVRPSRSSVSAFCTQLTTLTQAQVDNGIAFAEACALLQTQHHSHTCAWASWGNYDRRMFTDQCASYGVPYPFAAQHLNLKQRFAQRMKTTRQLGMAKALEVCQLPLLGTHHRGGDDAHNIARIAVYLYQRYGCDVLRADEVKS